MAARRVTKRAWFGPKRILGWGWTPTSPEGWAVIGVFLVLTLVSILLWPGVGATVAVTVLVALLLLVAILTGDPPGPRSAR